MGQIRKINDIYYIEFHARGLLYSQIAGSDLEEARKLLQQVEEKIAGGEALTISRHIELPDFFERYIDEAKKLGYSPRTIKRFESIISHFSGFLYQNYPQIHQVDQLTPALLESYKCHLIKIQKSKMVNLTVLLLREVLDFGIKIGFLNDNPSLHVRLLPWQGPIERKITARYELAKHLLSKGIGLGKVTQLLNLSDISRMVYFRYLIPLSREDMGFKGLS